MTSTEPDWAGIVRENPIFADPKLAGKTARWNTLKAAADRLGVDDDTAVQFIAYGMTDGEEGALPEGVSADDLKAALSAAADAETTASGPSGRA